MQTHGDGVRRARRAWNAGARLGGKDRAVGRLERQVWPTAVQSLGMEPGHVVLDVGCGAGHAFGPLRAAVGEAGRIVGVDVSPTMLARARAAADRRGWTDVELREADASSVDLGDAGYDVALAALRARFRRVEPVVGADGERAPFGEVAWPPVAAALATKSDS